jgi:hypothetical protein
MAGRYGISENIYQNKNLKGIIGIDVYYYIFVTRKAFQYIFADRCPDNHS